MLLAILIIGTFIVGMVEYAATGLLTQIADDMRVSISDAGLLIGVYVISIVLIGPLIRVIALEAHTHRLLPVLVTISIMNNLVGMLAPSFNILLLSKLMSAVMHAPFFDVCMSTAMMVAPPIEGTQATTLVRAGLTIAVMLGILFRSFLGDFTNWRIAFEFMTVLVIIAMLGMIKFISSVFSSTEANTSRELTVFRNPYILIVIAIIMLGYFGVSTTYTFMRPVIRGFSPFKTVDLTICLFMLGLGGMIGNLITGNMPEDKLTKNLYFTFLLLFVTTILFVTVIQNSTLALVICFLFDFDTFGTAPLLNSKTILNAKEALPLMGTLTASIFNVANLLGVIIESMLLSIGLPYIQVTLISGEIMVLGMPLDPVSQLYKKKHIAFDECS